MLVSFQMLPEQPAGELLEAIVVADRLGYYACYSADEIYHKDPWLLFAAAAARTERIRFGPCVSPIYMREPTYIVQLAATLDELSGGRAEVVFGIGNIAMLEQYGIEWKGTQPIDRLREAHAVMRALLETGEIDFSGDFYSYSGVTTAARPVQEHLPLKIGAMGGPRSMRLAGEICDGLHTACAYSGKALAYVAASAYEGAEIAGRDLAGFDLGDSLLGAIAPDPEVARRAARVLASFYIPSMPPSLLRRHGIEPEAVAGISEAFAAGDVRLALERTPQEISGRLALAGSPAEWIEWLNGTYVRSGMTHALVSFADPFTLDAWAGIRIEGLPSLGEQIRIVGEEVVPHLS